MLSKYKRFLSLSLALSLVVACFSGCGRAVGNQQETTASESQAVSSVQPLNFETEVVENINVLEEVTQTAQTTETTSASVENEIKEKNTFNNFEKDTAEFLLDLDDMKKSPRGDFYYETYFLLKDKLEFLSNDEFEIYIRALFAINEIDISYSISNIKEKIFWGEEDQFVFCSTYLSYIEYLNSVLTTNGTEEFLTIKNNEKSFLIVNDDLYISTGEQGGRLCTVEKEEYNLLKRENDKVVFEVLRYCYFESYEWIDRYTITLTNTENGWRAEIFDAWL